jgi:hypothetical protein
MQKRQRSSVVHVTTEDLAAREIPHIPDAVAVEAQALMVEQMRTGKIARERYEAARHLAQLFNTQNRLSPDRPSQHVQDLANLTIDELNALTEQMLGQTG